ncbi:hypothetical protein MXAN_2628 [Myxococcus xanthus DK 1622]|uniref:Uncharacterized protein n=1 Tax=Myxococcus xanthus (strain DK1622) TaxID=246197 RepID=Q1D926_MYXXD|nr:MULTISPECIES: hypothetical protein [Myxococcus]ABF90691.1 hypothetical protein MXAN_2628 [Myxococcus xanthus DK 1622]NOJ57997.1 hypothetical protein [Myxococcus xanthus]QPM82135.1 hypothetical protein I5Q59_13020 [Myxococcus xanthus]QVW71383.1 hypothetical protein JTM82_18375 [Myxococcus xanthus DZ2]QZZ50353.1 hypothetical protein MyxoNM_14165 [Myxococcus xanthus]
MSEQLPQSPSEEARARRIAELEFRLSRRRVGVRPMAAVMAIAVGLVLLGMQWKDLSYFLSPSVPLTLGAEGAYRFEALVSNRYAQVHGVPTVRGAYERADGALYVLVGLRDSPFVVRRPALPGEQWTDGRPPPQPDQRPFAVRGRLLAQADARRYRDALALMERMGELQPRDGRLWLLIEGERPGTDRGLLLVCLALVTFVVLNAMLLVRGLKRR